MQSMAITNIKIMTISISKTPIDMKASPSGSLLAAAASAGVAVLPKVGYMVGDDVGRSEDVGVMVGEADGTNVVVGVTLGENVGSVDGSSVGVNCVGI